MFVKINGAPHHLWRALDNAKKQETGRWLNNKAEESHLPIGPRERAMQRFRQLRCLRNIHTRLFVRPHPFQPGTPALLRRQVQTRPRRRPGRVAPALARPGSRVQRKTQTCTNSSDGTGSECAFVRSTNVAQKWSVNQGWKGAWASASPAASRASSQRTTEMRLASICSRRV